MTWQSDSGELLPNLLHFGRLLRELGVKVSVDHIAELARALPQVNFTQRPIFYYTARCYLIKDREQFPLFDRAFEMFWAGQQTWLLQFGMTRQRREVKHDPLPQSKMRLNNPPPHPGSDQMLDSDAPLRVEATYSAVEILRAKKFEAFTDEELALAKVFITTLRWKMQPRRTRRYHHTRKRARVMDLSHTIRRSMAYGGELLKLDWQQRKRKPRPLVVICDISGSMDRFARLFLHFVHSLNTAFGHLEAFVFGTRLTRITIALRHRDVDTALDQVASEVVDWSGGTRIGECLRTFNYDWSRRVLGRGAVVIIISDGWDRGDVNVLGQEMSRLSRSVSRLIWLNPLAGEADYEPLAKGMQAALPFCDDFLPLHNLASLEQLAMLLQTLSRP